MPVFHHIGAAREICVDVETELAVVGRILIAGGPVGGLGVGLGDEVVGVFEGAGVVALLCLGLAIHVVLGAVVWVVGGDVEGLRYLKLVDVAAHGTTEVLRNKLIGTAVFADERGLPVEVVGDPHLLPARPLQFVTSTDRAVAGGHVLPTVDVLAPVVETPGFVEVVAGAKLLLQVIDDTY